jgi:AraC-like DNA-binding protein
MDALPLGRATALIPYVRFLAELGSPVERELEIHGLPVGLLEVPEAYIPVRNNWAFLDTMARSQDVPDLGVRVAELAGLEVASAPLRARLNRAPSLLAAIRTFCDECWRESSGMRCWLSTDGDVVEFHLRKSFGPEVRGYGQTEWLGLMAMMSVVRLFAGRCWQPEKISLRAIGSIPRRAEERFPQAVILAEQRSAFFTIPKGLLRLRLKRDRPYSATTESTPGAGPAFDLLGCLRQLLPAYLADGYPHIELAAELLRTNTRTLQRRLAEAGLSYSRLVDDVRMHTASSLLAETDRPMLEISRRVGYSDPSNFARAFHRHAGESPTSYRAGRAGPGAAR